MFKYLNIAAAVILFTHTSLADNARTVGSIDLTGIASKAMMGDASNVRLMVNLNMFPPREGSAAVITGVGWDLTLETVGASWLSEAAIGFTGDGGDFFEIIPCSGFPMPGSANCNSGGIVDLATMGIPDMNLQMGIVDLEFYETYDDIPGGDDAIYVMGRLDLEFIFIPEPTGASLWLAVLAALGWRRFHTA